MAAQGNFDAAGVFAGLVLPCAVVVIVELGVTRLERRLLRWKAPPSDDLLAA